MKKKFRSVEFNGQRIDLEIPSSDSVTMGFDAMGNKLFIVNSQGTMFRYDTTNETWGKMVTEKPPALLEGLRKLLP